MNRIGPIHILEGPSRSKVPFSRSLFIQSSVNVLIDTGAESELLQRIKHDNGVDLVINTHYHPDHTRHNYLFSSTDTLINQIEYKTASTIDDIAKQNGIYQEWGPQGVEKWKHSIPQKWTDSLNTITGSYSYNEEYRFGDVKVFFLHTPGHTKGFACPYFPDLGTVYVGDYDMTRFGPWYNGTDGNIQEFIESGKRLVELDAETYITGHQKGTFTKNEFKQEMKKYLEIIEQRDERILEYVNQGLTFEEITDIGIFYPKSVLSEPLLKTWERSGIRKHLERLGKTVPNSENIFVTT